MTRIEWLLTGFLAGLIVWTYIHTLRINWKLNKLLRALDEAYYEASSELCEAKKSNDPDYIKSDKIEKLKLCQAVFHILGIALRKRMTEDAIKKTEQKPAWKPSKEQIIALRWVLNNVPYNKHKEEISGLLEQIKDFV